MCVIFSHPLHSLKSVYLFAIWISVLFFIRESNNDFHTNQASHKVNSSYFLSCGSSSRNCYKTQHLPSESMSLPANTTTNLIHTFLECSSLSTRSHNYPWCTLENRCTLFYEEVTLKELIPPRIENNNLKGKISDPIRNDMPSIEMMMFYGWWW